MEEQEMTVNEIVSVLRGVKSGYCLLEVEYNALAQAADTLEEIAEITAKSAYERLLEDR